MTFEEWFVKVTECSLEDARRYALKHPHMYKCWQAATLAERERAAAIVLAECTPDCNCPECANLKAIATTIRKGEGV